MGIQFDNVTYCYEEGVQNHLALDELLLELREGSFTAVLGASGSGKSTLLQHMNGLLLPNQGAVRILDYTLEAPSVGKRRFRRSKGLMETKGDDRANGPRSMLGLRRRVGLVFQFPEQQLFEETVEQDLRFGPLNYGASEAEATDAAHRAAELLGIDLKLLKRSPFELSDGQMRKAAIAGVLASDPDIIVLDEPTASLDPQSRLELMQLLQHLCKSEGKTIVIVTHQLEEVLRYADEFVVLSKGRAIFQGDSGELLRQSPKLVEASIVLPPSAKLLIEFAERFGVDLPNEFLDAEKAAQWIQSVLDSRGWISS